MSHEVGAHWTDPSSDSTSLHPARTATMSCLEQQKNACEIIAPHSLSMILRLKSLLQDIARQHYPVDNMNASNCCFHLNYRQSRMPVYTYNHVFSLFT